MSYKNIVFELTEDGIATLVVSRSAKLNAIDRATMEELGTAFGYARNEPDIRGLILTGEGEKAFVAGADIQELTEMSPVQAVELSTFGQQTFRCLEIMRKPSIAAVNGYALGAGLELAMACTARVAVPGAKLGLPELKLGLIPGYGGTQRLPALVGRAKALELILTGEMIGAEEAMRIGLVNRIATPEALLQDSRSLMKAILANSPVAVGLAMDVIDAGCGPEAGMRLESAKFGLAASTEDCKEGTKAFFERRPPVFTGR